MEESMNISNETSETINQGTQEPNMLNEAMKHITPAELEEWMKRVEESNEIQAKYAKKQCFRATLSAVFMFIVMVAVVATLAILTPAVVATLDQANTTMRQLDSVTAELNTVASDLAKADLVGMLDNVNSLVVDGQKDLSEAMEKINQMDIETLNKAIAELHAVVQPMARLFGMR